MADSDDTQPLATAPELDDILPDPETFPLGAEDPQPDALLGSPLVPPATVIAWAVKRNEGLKKIEARLQARAADTEYGKFNKGDAYYFPKTPFVIDGAWEYNCHNCRFYEENPEGDCIGKCSIVGLESDHLGGECIHPDGWCALYMPKDDSPYFDYIRERVGADESD